MAKDPVITLISDDGQSPLRKWRATQTDIKPGVVIPATDIEEGKKYRILFKGTTDFTLIGASNNNVGTDFVATGAGSGTGTVGELVTYYNVKAGSESDRLIFYVWNNKKTKEYIDITISSGVTQNGTVVIKIDGTDHDVNVTTSTDTDTIANQIKSALEVALPTWTISVLPKIEMDGYVVRNSIVSLVSPDYQAYGDIGFDPGTTGIGASITRPIVGNPGDEMNNRITDLTLNVRDSTGNTTGDVVNSRWLYAKDTRTPNFKRLGMNRTDPQNEFEEHLDVSAVNAIVQPGQILGEVNDGSLSDDTNYAKVEIYLQPDFHIEKGLRPFKLLLTYNFT
jgi:hypothetical protein